jgi:ubiquinone/menaquinone biosynthesis C-methylase UbiE
MIQNLYKKALDIYFKFKPHRTGDWEKYWSKRTNGKDWHFSQTNWVDGYWNSREHPHRELLTNAIVKYNPDTILEIGCASAPNIAILNEKLPRAKIVGVDINESAINRAMYELRMCNNIHFYNMSMDKMGFADKYFDVTFTDAVLIYIGKDKIVDIMNNIKRITSKAVVFLERHLDGVGWEEYYKDGLWYRDYVSLVNEFFPKSMIKLTKITSDVWKEWSEYGYLVEVKL